MKINWFKIKDEIIVKLYIDIISNNNNITFSYLRIYLKQGNVCKDCEEFYKDCYCNYCYTCHRRYCSCDLLNNRDIKKYITTWIIYNLERTHIYYIIEKLSNSKYIDIQYIQMLKNAVKI